MTKIDKKKPKAKKSPEYSIWVTGPTPKKSAAMADQIELWIAAYDISAYISARKPYKAAK